MSTIEEEFKKYNKQIAADHIRAELSLAEKKELYGLWCVVTRGKCTQPAPSRLRLVAYGKWQAWKKYDHLTADEARLKFVERVKQILCAKSKL